MPASAYRVPGLSREEVRPETVADFRTGVPAILVAASLPAPLALGSLGQLPPALLASLSAPALAAVGASPAAVPLVMGTRRVGSRRLVSSSQPR